MFLSKKFLCKLALKKEILQTLIYLLLQSVRNAFFKVDDDHDGILTMHEFRRMLDSFMFIITGKH